MPRDRKGAQLALELPPELLERLRARAAADGRPLAVLVRRWLEAGLSGALEQQATTAAPAAGAELLARVEALEAAVSDLHRPASPERVSAAPRSGEPVTPKRVPMGAGTL
jgi:plasmid stability protein